MNLPDEEMDSYREAGILPTIRPAMILPKESALHFAKKWAPLYAEVFSELKAEGGRVKLPGRFAQFRLNVATYVQLYDDERKPGVALLLAFLGEDGFREFNQETANWSQEQLAEFVDEIGSNNGKDWILDWLDFPESEEEWAEQEEKFLSMSEEEKAAAIKTSGFFFSAFFAQFFNTLALMTHGATMTTLVKRALQNDDDAFLKAAQVDRLLLTHHPFFVARKQRAQDAGETEFLSALAYRESNPNLKGKIRYPALFMLFGLLESTQWLDKLKHEEILNLCDEIGLDRFQNRIEDVNCLTKRLHDYRKFQKTGGMSMQ